MISEATAASVRKMLEGVLGPGGTASGAAIKGYDARRQDRHGREGDQRRVLQGQVRRVVRRLRARAKHPKLLVAVMVDEPKGEIYGGQVAAPAWRKIVNFALGYLKIGPELDVEACVDVFNQSVPVRGCRPARRATPALREAL